MTTETASPGTGSSAPDVDVTTPAGGTVQLSLLWQERPLVLAFFGDLANPFTGDRAAQLRDANEYIEETGGDLCAVSAGTVEQAAAFRQRWALPYPVLPDSERRAFAAFGVERTATFVVDSGGIIRYERRTENLANFPPTTDLFAAVCAITGAEMPAPPAAPILAFNEPLPSVDAGGRDGKAGYVCAKCGGVQYERTQVSTAGGFLSRLFNVQHRKFEAVTCLVCGYTELYRQGSSALGNLIDFVAN